MINGLTIEEKINVIHPLPDGVECSKNGIPIMKKDDIDINKLSEMKFLNIENKTNNKKAKATILISFKHDKKLETYWNHIFKYIPKFLKHYAVCTPDFSLYPNMNIIEMKFNVYRNRYLGCVWQYYGVKVIPTIQWADEKTFDFCFDGVEKGSCVIVSTMGCQKNKEAFLKGYNEMLKRIEPELIIVYGDLIKGMSGKILQVKYEDAFASKDCDFEQLSLFPVSKIIEIAKEGENQYGW